MNNWTKLADEQTIKRTVKALKANGIDVVVVENGQEAKNKALELLPKGAEVMNMTSVTLDTIGIPQIINESGDYDAVRPKLMKMDRKTQGRKMQKLGVAPQWSIGSVHAVTQEGQVVTVSNTGSQLPAYAYGSSHVIWVVGTQKIVKNLDEAMKRINEHTLASESERVKKAYGMSHSNVSKVLIVNKEVMPARLTMILVKQALGY